MGGRNPHHPVRRIKPADPASDEPPKLAPIGPQSLSKVAVAVLATAKSSFLRKQESRVHCEQRRSGFPLLRERLVNFAKALIGSQGYRI